MLFLKKLGAFRELFLGAFDKYVEILCYFGSFSKVLGAFGSYFGAFLTNFGNSTEILCYFLKAPKFGRSPKIWEPATALALSGLWKEVQDNRKHMQKSTKIK